MSDFEYDFTAAIRFYSSSLRVEIMRYGLLTDHVKQLAYSKKLTNCRV